MPSLWVSSFAAHNNPDEVLVTISLRSHDLPEITESVDGEGQRCSSAFRPCLCDFRSLVTPVCKEFLFICLFRLYQHY